MIRITTAVLAALALGACATEIGDRSEARNVFGDSVRQNIAAQTVNPEGSSADVVSSGARVNKAVQAHASDKVEKPGSASTMGGAASGGSAQQ